MNGAAGVVVTFDSQPVAIMGFIVADGKVVEVDVILGPERVVGFNPSALDRR